MTSLPAVAPEPASPLDDGRATTRQKALARRCQGWKTGLLPALYLILGAILLFALFAGIGLLLTKVGSHDVIGRTDRATERWFARDRQPELNEITHYTTDLGETFTVIAAGLALAVVSRLKWGRWREPVLVAVALAGEVTIFVAITLLIDRHRPSVPHLDAAPPTSSFPSGHTAASVVLYVLIALLLASRLHSGLASAGLWLLAVIVPVAVGLSRLYRGMHYPTDVLMGVVLGAAWLSIAVKGVRLGALQRDLRLERTIEGGNA
jgi:membrane-associated phospholipid phosphatase